MQIYNTLSRRKEPLRPLRDGEVSLYVCGMTVYERCHLGHARVLVAFDALTRALRALGHRVRYVRNITDIDDKIIKRARERGEPFTALTARCTDALHEDERALGVLPPDVEPRATAHIDEMQALIQRLLESGHAYASDGDVYYAVRSFPGYGKLSNKNPDELLAGARIAPSERKRDPRDFALWKRAEADDEPRWPSPWGPGRPGWHIECSAMALCHLGDSFDIHGGGPDLVFPHHENEIAQSEAATGAPFARLWMHVGPLRLGAEKMSKSLGNVARTADALATRAPEAVRYFLLSSHYRSPMDYSPDQLDEAARSLRRLYTALRSRPAAPTGSGKGAPDDSPWSTRFFSALRDDFNTPEALATLFDLARAANAASDATRAAELAAELRALGEPLGLLQDDAEAFLTRPAASALSAPDEVIGALVAERDAARAGRDYQHADALRERLTDLGVALEDGADGTLWRRS